MAFDVRGRIHWEGGADDSGHRTYKITFLIASDDVDDGPALVMQIPGVPVPGSVWNFGNDVDIWAWARPNLDVRPKESNQEGVRFWELTVTFSTKPPSRDAGGRAAPGTGGPSGPPSSSRCADFRIEDPLMEPQKVSGSFVKFTKEFTRDRFDFPIRNSAFEMIRGPQVEFDKTRYQVRVEQNVLDLQWATVNQMADTVNDATLWGFPPRFVKLVDFSWEKKYYGACSIYYTRNFTFEVWVEYDATAEEYVSGWDRRVLDEGSKVLCGHWGDGSFADNFQTGWVLEPIDPGGVFQPNRFNPADFFQATDRAGNPTRLILNGKGVPYDATGATTGTGDDAPGMNLVEAYGESNFLLLGIPTSW